MTKLTDSDRALISEARQLASLAGIDDIRAFLAETGSSLLPGAGNTTVYLIALGRAQYLLAELTVIAEHLEREDDDG